jgi:hypothetical protein
MQYIIFPDINDETVPMTRKVDDEDAEYLNNVICPLLQPLTADEYKLGPAGILRTFAKFSYVLKDNKVFWCIEWKPGLLVIEFSTSGTIRWAALRSPNPEFGGRTATEEELDAFDEDATNHQYNLIFRAWDPQIDSKNRQGWQRASSDENYRFEAALAHANKIQMELKERCKTEDALIRWTRRCKRSPIWQGKIAMG